MQTHEKWSLFNEQPIGSENFLLWEKLAIQLAFILEYYANTLLHTIDPDNTLLIEYSIKWTDEYGDKFNVIWQVTNNKTKIRKLLYDK